MNNSELHSALSGTFTGLDPSSFRKTFIKGKVRDILDLGGEMVIVTTDRISAFDKVLTTIPYKGEVLNRISLFWFRKTADIIPNHILREVNARTVLVKKYRLLPLEVVVRGYLTGSAWRDYRAGKDVSGHKLPAGMKANEAFPQPLLTPSTKEERGHHDKPISKAEILEEGIVSKDTWQKVENKAFALFERGRELARSRGLILVDTKYEFGFSGDELVLVDEIHTSDSSRYWYADSYNELFSRGENPIELDKEYFRRWLMDRGYQGDGEPPEITEEIRVEVAERYIRAFEEITGETFVPEELSGEEIRKSIAAAVDL
jgi:phosphoribosylaminoimidazole-succinocarboxamide synthase